MNQIKIGKFISELRKEKKLTQKDLADKLGVTDRAVSKWENGRGMPDISSLKTICEVLDISLNELLSGEKIDDKDKEIKFEENYFNTVNSKVKLQSDITGYLVFKLIGYLLLVIGLGFYAVEALWINIVTIVGSIFVIIGSYKLVRSWNILPKIMYVLVVSVALFLVINYFDYLRVYDGDISKPHFYYKKITKDNCTLYKKIAFSCLSITNGEMSDGTCYIFEKESNGKYLLLMEEYNKIEDGLNIKYCKKDYDPYEDGLYRKLDE